jgi:MFS family permease
MTHPSARRIALLAAASLTVMSSATIAPSLPHMAEVFAGTPDATFLAKLILTAPALTIAVMAPVSGFIIDHFGRTRYLFACLLLYALAGSSGLYLNDLRQILAGRALLGVAVGGTMTCVAALAGDYFTGEARTRYVSTQSAFMSLGGVVFVGLGGLLADLHWRAPFGVYLLSLLVLGLGLFCLDEPPRHRSAAPGGATGPAPAFPLRTIAALYLLQFLGMLAYYLMSAQVPFYLRQIGVEQSALAGLTIAGASLVSGLSTLSYRRILRFSSHLGIYAIGFAIMAAGYMLMGWAGSMSGVMVSALAVGCGIGLVFPNGTTWLLSVAPPSHRGRLAGGLTAAIFLGQFFSPIAIQPLAGRLGLSASYEMAGLVLGLLAAGIWVLHIRAAARALRVEAG